jgi:drug/metabolite transporter (DMT)-like permease
VLSQITGIVVVLLVAGFLPSAHPGSADFVWGAAAGLVGGGGLALFYRALGRSKMTVVAPVTALTTTAVPVIFGLAAGEKPGTLPMTGIALAVLAILLVSATVAPNSDGSAWRLRGAIPRSAMAAALASGVCFGGFYVIIRHTSPAAGVWPLAASRSTSAFVYLIGALIMRHPLPLRAPRAALPTIIAAGVMDMTANIFYLLATHRGLLTIVATLSSLYPATTLILARVVLKERVNAVQSFGLLVAAVAVMLISVG